MLIGRLYGFTSRRDGHLRVERSRCMQVAHSSNGARSGVYCLFVDRSDNSIGFSYFGLRLRSSADEAASQLGIREHRHRRGSLMRASSSSGRRAGRHPQIMPQSK